MSAKRRRYQDRAVMNDSALVKGKKLPTAEGVGQRGYGAMLGVKPVFVPGLLNKLLVQSIRFTPRRVVTNIVKKMSAPGS